MNKHTHTHTNHTQTPKSICAKTDDTPALTNWWTQRDTLEHVSLLKTQKHITTTTTTIMAMIMIYRTLSHLQNRPSTPPTFCICIDERDWQHNLNLHSFSSFRIWARQPTAPPDHTFNRCINTYTSFRVHVFLRSKLLCKLIFKLEQRISKSIKQPTRRVRRRFLRAPRTPNSARA